MNYKLILGIYFKTPHAHKVRKYITDVETKIGKSLIIIHQEKRDRGLYEVRCSVILSSNTFIDGVIEAFSLLSNLSRAVVITIPLRPEHNTMNAYINDAFLTDFITFIDVSIDRHTESEIHIF